MRLAVAAALPSAHALADACARYRGLLVDHSTFHSVTFEELLDANVLPAHTATALRKRYIPR